MSSRVSFSLSTHVMVITTMKTRRAIQTIIALPKFLAWSFLMTLLKNRSPRKVQTVMSTYVSVSIVWSEKKPGNSRNSMKTDRTARQIPLRIRSVFVPSPFRDTLRTDAEANPYTMVAHIVVVSTIHPMAVLPRNGMGRDRTTIRIMAFSGTCLLLSFLKRSGRIPSCATAKHSRLPARSVPTRLVKTKARREAMSMYTPASPM